MKKLNVIIAILILTVAACFLVIAANAQRVDVIPARLYGAIPNDGHNDKAALKYLIRVVSARPNTFILLEPGKYDVKKLRIDYEILQDMGRTEETTPAPKGFVKMYFIFLVPEASATDLALVK